MPRPIMLFKLAIMLFKLAIMLLSNAPKFSLLCPSYALLPYGRKFSDINIFGSYNEICISEIKFWNLVYLQILP